MMDKASRLPLFTYLLVLVSCTYSCEPTGPSIEQEMKPNIIFLLTDDQRWDAMGAMGNPHIVTPEMDKLAAEGVLFKNAYVTTPICCTSRASFLSGQYARRHGINDFKTSFSDSAWQNCYPQQLANVGYYNGFIGKFGVGRGPDMPAQDFDFWRGIPGQPKYEHRDSAGNYIHLTRILGSQCLEFLDSVPNSQPFCLSVSFKAPHVQDNDPRQFLYDSTYIDLLADQTMPAAKLAGAFDNFPAFFKEDNEARRRWDVRFSTSEKFQASVKGYYRLIYGVDQVIGRIRTALAERGMAENTIIILMGDNGFFLGEKGLAGKWYAYEESIRVPLLIFDPHLPAAERGQKRSEMVLNIDVAPTLLAYAGMSPPGDMQGKDLSKLYKGQNPEWRQDFLFEHEFVHPRIPMSEGVVTLQDKYFRYLPPAPEYEAYQNLTDDPDESQNLIGDELHQPRIEALKTRLEELIALYQ